MTVTIRNTKPSDTAALQTLFSDESVYATTLQLPYPALATWQSRLSNPSPQVHAYVATEDAVSTQTDEQTKNVVGYLTVTQASEPRQRHCASLFIAVKQDHHGQGVGSALMTAAINLADNWLNLHRLELTVHTDNESAIASYKKFGFVIEGEAVDIAFRAGQYVNAYYMARVPNQ